MERIQSFKSFSQVKVQLKEQTTQKEISAKREAASSASPNGSAYAMKEQDFYDKVWANKTR